MSPPKLGIRPGFAAAPGSDEYECILCGIRSGLGHDARRALDHAPEMAGDDLRRAAETLGRVTGAIGVEDILGEVFSTFCIGK